MVLMVMFPTTRDCETLMPGLEVTVLLFSSIQVRRGGLLALATHVRVSALHASTGLGCEGTISNVCSSSGGKKELW